MQYLHVFATLAQHVGAQDVGILHPLVFHEVGESFFLHTGHIQDVGIGYGVFGEVLTFLKSNAVFLAVALVLLGHLEFARSYEVECWVVWPHRHEERVYRASVFQVAHHVDVQVFQCALSLVDAVEVEHRLRRMQVASVACVDDRHVGHLAGIERSPFESVAHHDHVGIVAHHLYRVLQCLALRRACHLRVGKSYHPCSQAVGSRLEREACACRGFKKQCSHHLAFE